MSGDSSGISGASGILTAFGSTQANDAMKVAVFWTQYLTPKHNAYTLSRRNARLHLKLVNTSVSPEVTELAKSLTPLCQSILLCTRGLP